MAFVHGGGDVESPVGAALHFLIRAATKHGRLGVHGRDRLITEGTVAAGVGGAPGSGHAEDSRATRTGNVSDCAHDLDEDVVQRTLVHGGGDVVSPVGAA